VSIEGTGHIDLCDQIGILSFDRPQGYFKHHPV